MVYIRCSAISHGRTLYRLRHQLMHHLVYSWRQTNNLGLWRHITTFIEIVVNTNISFGKYLSHTLWRLLSSNYTSVSRLFSFLDSLKRQQWLNLQLASRQNFSRFCLAEVRRFINQLIDYLNPNMRHWLMDEVTKGAQSSLRGVTKVFVKRLLTILQDINSIVRKFQKIKTHISLIQYINYLLLSNPQVTLNTIQVILKWNHSFW